MKLILSRKGFDTSAGGGPSPILTDHQMVSLPIPDRYSAVTYGDITHNGVCLGPLVEDLTKGRLLSHWGAHIDPDLRPGSLPRLPHWRPIFGQRGSAQAHLGNHQVGPGDLFLFFGLFRPAEQVHGTYRWVLHSRPCHVIWGWLQVAEVLSLATSRPQGYDWAAYHPHFQRGADAKNNVVYVAQPTLQLHQGGYHRRRKGLPGAGAFPHFFHSLQLTAADGHKPSVWHLPAWFYPGRGRTPLSYHGDTDRWQRQGSRTALQSVGRGQEFVLKVDEYPEAIPWVYDLLETALRGGRGNRPGMGEPGSD